MCLHTCTTLREGLLHVQLYGCDLGSMHAVARVPQSPSGLEASRMMNRQCRVPVYAVLQKLPLEYPSSYEKEGGSPMLACC